MGICCSTEDELPLRWDAHSVSSRHTRSSSRIRRSLHADSTAADEVELYSGVGSIVWADLVVGQAIGSGLSGHVYEAGVVPTDLNFAAKVHKNHCQWLHELSVLSALQGCYWINELVAAGPCHLPDQKPFCSEHFLLLERLRGPDLYSRATASNEPVSETTLRVWAIMMLSAVDHCHRKFIAHRDLKASSFVFTSGSDDATLKLIDFDQADFLDANCTYRRKSGTLYYLSPELLRGEPISSDAVLAADMWAIGVTLFWVISGGCYPFRGYGPLGSDEHVASTIANIQSGIVEMPPSITDSLMDLLNGLLHTDHRQRFSCGKALSHQWVRKSRSSMRRFFRASRSLAAASSSSQSMLLPLIPRSSRSGESVER